MSNWISNKLKVAETLLQQIDQQAAESLRKGEKPPANDSRVDVPTKSSGIVPLKDQLKKKSVEENEHLGKLRSDLNRNRSFTNPDNEAKPKHTLTDSDWTELLGPPDQPTNLGSRKIDGKTLGGNLGAIKGNRNQKNASNSSLVKSARRSTVSLGRKINGGKPSDGEESASSSSRSSNAELHNDVRNPEGQGQRAKDKEKLNNYAANINQHLEIASLSGGANARSDINIRAKDMDRLRSSARKNHELNTESVASISKSSKRDSSSTSDGGTDSSDSGSSSGSESEREREERRRRREKLLAEKAAAKAIEAIKERENVVAKLEGEKQSLDKILEERAKQQAKEASELQTTMMETMEAVEVEKQKHNNTRMEALALLAKLETANADLARSLAAAQKKLEAEIDQVAELRQEIELKEVAHEETKRSISNTHKKGKYLNHLAASKGVEFEREILEAEYSVLNDKILQLQEKAKTFEVNIEMTRKELEDPTEVEIELKRRLGQLTDHLIQKQAQVEALSSEKATLAFRIEAVSRMLDENKSMTGASSRDVESGTWEFSQSKFKPMFEDKIRSGRKHIGSLVLQLDSIFLAGMVFLRRNPTGKLWALVYLVCLHFWVIYIMMSHSQPSDEASGAVFSLENLNNTAG